MSVLLWLFGRQNLLYGRNPLAFAFFLGNALLSLPCERSDAGGRLLGFGLTGGRRRRNAVGGDVENGLAVDLQSAGGVKLHLDLPSAKDRHMLCVLDVLALEDARKKHQRFEAAGSVPD